MDGQRRCTSSAASLSAPRRGPVRRARPRAYSPRSWSLTSRAACRTNLCARAPEPLAGVGRAPAVSGPAAHACAYASQTDGESVCGCVHVLWVTCSPWPTTPRRQGGGAAEPQRLRSTTPARCPTPSRACPGSNARSFSFTCDKRSSAIGGRPQTRLWPSLAASLPLPGLHARERRLPHLGACDAP